LLVRLCLPILQTSADRPVGFSAGGLRDRIVDAQSRVVITSDEGRRGGKLIRTKKIVDEALEGLSDVQSLVYRRTGADVPWTQGRDLWWHDEVEKWYASRYTG
jgi:acetyl-CoA synthetase